MLSSERGILTPINIHHSEYQLHNNETYYGHLFNYHQMYIFAKNMLFWPLCIGLNEFSKEKQVNKTFLLWYRLQFFLQTKTYLTKYRKIWQTHKSFEAKQLINQWARANDHILRTPPVTLPRLSMPPYLNLLKLCNYCQHTDKMKWHGEKNSSVGTHVPNHTQYRQRHQISSYT